MPTAELNSETISISKSVEYPENLKQLHKNVLAYYLDIPIDSVKVDGLLEDLDENGSWPDIDYTNKRRGNWPVPEHLENLQALAIAYQSEGSKYYHKDSVSEKINHALNYWLKHDFLSTNWWDQHIGVPELLLPTLFLMEDELSDKQMAQALPLLQRAKIKMTGQNKVWLAGNVLFRSLLTRDADSVAIASKAIQEELHIATGVGIKDDWSYHEHGAQLQFGNYGLSYLEDMIKWNTILAATPFQFSEEKIAMLRNYILNGQQWVVWNGKFDISASGRRLFIDGSTEKYQRLKNSIQEMMAFDEEYKTDYENAIDSKVLSGNRHFWRSDFQVHRRKEFYFSVKMSSERVIGTESVNEENIQGYHLGDGVALLYDDAADYENIFPYWDWRKLPGTTLIQDTAALPIIKAWDFKTNSKFVGGVSNGKNGIAAMEYDRDGLRANKSWFMFGNKILCLGSGISTDSPFPVATTLDQVFLKGEVEISKNGTISREMERNQTLEPDWILHNGTGYLFPAGGSVNMASRFMEGSWNRVAKRYRPVILTDHILKFWFDHGDKPVNATYANVLVPNADKEQLRRLNELQPFEFINRNDHQSAITSDGKLAGIVFYEPGKSNLFGGIEAAQPCVLMIEKTAAGLKLWVSDPTQELKNIELSISGNFTGNYSAFKNNKTNMTIPLPAGEAAGKTVELHLEGQ